MDSELSVGWCLRQANEHLTKARATSNAEVREHCLALVKGFIELAAELENGPTMAEIRDALIARGANS
jgi:hypothetical protein